VQLAGPEVAVADDCGRLVLVNEQLGNATEYRFGQPCESLPRHRAVQRAVELAERGAHKAGLAIAGQRVEVVLGIPGLQDRQLRRLGIAVGRQQIVEQLRTRRDPFGHARRCPEHMNAAVQRRRALVQQRQVGRALRDGLDQRQQVIEADIGPALAPDLGEQFGRPERRRGRVAPARREPGTEQLAHFAADRFDPPVQRVSTGEPHQRGQTGAAFGVIG